MKHRQIYFWLVISILGITISYSQTPPFYKVDKTADIIQRATPHPPVDTLGNIIEGKVYVEVTIGVDSVARNPKVFKSDNSELDQVSIEAAMKSKYSSAMLNGKPVEYKVVIPFVFVKNKSAETK